jgi:hypothetical protein
MKRLCASLLLLTAAFSTACLGQQIALLNAPEPMPAVASSSLPAVSSSLSGSAAAAIMPVPVKRPDVKPGLALQDWGLLAAAAALRFGDYKSTVKCMSDPANFREVELPNALVHNRPAFGAFEASIVVANYYTYRIFVRHDHRTLARVGQYINIGAMAWTVGRNYYELNEFWPRDPSTLKH